MLEQELPSVFMPTGRLCGASFQQRMIGLLCACNRA
jgi:hypothetical protein